MALDINTKTRVFLDRKAFTDAVGKATAQAMHQAGYVVRNYARNSMKMRKGPSAPGSPPHAHSKKRGKAGEKSTGRGPLLKKMLYSEYDLTAKTMVIGPTKLPGSKFRVPQLQEFGGHTVRKTKIIIPSTRKPSTPAQREAYNLAIRAGKRQAPVKAKVQYKKEHVVLPARPYMRPTLTATMPKFPSLFANTVKN
jgi:hypothetical protein